MGGYAMVDALTAVAIAGIAAAFSLQLLARSASDIRQAHSRIAATRLAEQLYEEARFEGAQQLLEPRHGREGGLDWVRTAMPLRDKRPGMDAEIPPVTVAFAISQSGRAVLALEAIVQPNGAGATRAAATRSPKS